MRYTPGELTELFDEIVRQGGALLPDPCQARDERYDPDVYTEGPRIRKRATQGCGRETMFVHTYDPGDDVKRSRGSGFVRACACCDNVGLWPRYAAVLETADGDED